MDTKTNKNALHGYYDGTRQTGGMIPRSANEIGKRLMVFEYGR